MAAAGQIDELLGTVRTEVRGADPVLATPFPVGEVAAVALATIGAGLHRLTAATASVRVDVIDAAASLLSFLYLQVDATDGISLFRDVNPAFSTFHRCRDDRWIHLHGGFPHLRDGTAALLGVAGDADHETVAAACARHDAFVLEDQLASAGMCGAVARTPDEWRDHPQGQAMAGQPAVRVTASQPAVTRAPARSALAGDDRRPLRGLRVLDCTRVLAGPTCGRTLAALGADVLRVGSSRLPTIAMFEIDTGAGKRAADVDLDSEIGRTAFGELLAGADVVVWGYRRDASVRHGLDPSALAASRPGLVTVGLTAYGARGPWADRRGWEQLAQTATGIATVQGTTATPALIPAAATDYTTGYLAAAGVVAALADHPGGAHVEVSLVQTAQWLLAAGATLEPDRAAGIPAQLVADRLVEEQSPWGRVRRLPFPLTVDGLDLGWDHPAEPLGSSAPVWRPR